MHYDAIVLGTGGIGSAAVYQLAKRGARVLGIDRFDPPHDRGSTHGQTRIIRQAYFEHPDYVPLLLESYRGWHELEAQSQQQLFSQVGLLQTGPPDGIVVPGVLRAADEHRLNVESLSSTEISNRWPGLRVDADHVGAFEPAAGYLLVEKCVEAHLDAARAAGATLMTNTEVTSCDANDRGVVVKIVGGTQFTANRLIITAGPWATKWLDQQGSLLVVRRKSLFWFETTSNQYDASHGFPTFLLELPHGVFYGFPKIDDRGLKFAEHSGGQIVGDPLAVNRERDATEERQLVGVLRQHLPGVSQRATNHAVCLYTMSPDENFLVGAMPTMPNTYIAAGLSGHGFKFAPVLGQALADLALDGNTALPIGFLSPTRFAS